MKKNYQLFLACLLIAGLVMLSVMLSDKFLSRGRVADLTAEKLYTLTEGTHHILAGLNRPLTLRLYYSREVAKTGAEGMRFWHHYFFYVRDLLQEYVRLANGNLTLEIYDPQPYSDDEEQAIQAGLQSYGVRGESFLFGLIAITEFGKQNILPFFAPDRQLFVEYDVTKIISDLTRREKLNIGVISSLPILGDEIPPHLLPILQMQGKKIQPAWLIIQNLRQTYQVNTAIVSDNQFTKKFDYLLIVHPRSLDTATLKAIDHYVANAGRVIIFVDPFCFSDAPTGKSPTNAPEFSSSNLNTLTEKWGVTIPSNELVIDAESALSLTVQNNRPPELFLPFLGLRSVNVNQQISVTAGLNELRLLFAGNLLTRKIDEIIIEPLLFTSARGNIWRPHNEQIATTPPAAKLLAALNPANESVKEIGVLLRGKFGVNFPTTKPPTENSLVAIIADVDMLNNDVAYENTEFGITRAGDGAIFLANLLEFMGGDENLITMRTRGAYLRPLTVIQEIEKQAEQEVAEKIEMLNENIAAREKELSAIIQRNTGNNAKLLSKEIIDKQREIETAIRQHTKQLRQLQQTRHDRVKNLEHKFVMINLLVAPLLVLLAMSVMLVYKYRRH